MELNIRCMGARKLGIAVAEAIPHVIGLLRGNGAQRPLLGLFDRPITNCRVHERKEEWHRGGRKLPHYNSGICNEEGVRQVERHKVES